MRAGLHTAEKAGKDDEGFKTRFVLPRTILLHYSMLEAELLFQVAKALAVSGSDLTPVKCTK